MPEPSEDNLQIIKAINERLAADPPLISIPSIARFPCMTKGAFRQLPLMEKQELFVQSARMGDRDGILFLCYPVDTQTWDYCEIPEKKFIDLFPGKEALLVDALGEDSGATTFYKAKKNFIKKLNAAAVEAEELAAVAEFDRNKHNDLWGSF